MGFENLLRLHRFDRAGERRRLKDTPRRLDKEQQERFDGKMQGFSVLTNDSGHCSWGSSLYRHRVLCYMFSILTAPKCEKGPNICYIL